MARGQHQEAAAYLAASIDLMVDDEGVANMVKTQGKIISCDSLHECVLKARIKLMKSLSELGDVVSLEKCKVLTVQCWSYLHNKHWTGPLGSMEDVVHEDNQFQDATVRERREYFAVASEVAVQLQFWPQAVGFGEMAAEMNRHYRGVYHPISQGYHGLGERDKAVEALQRAVAFEECWDPAHTAKMQQMLNDFLAAEKSENGAGADMGETGETPLSEQSTVEE